MIKSSFPPALAVALACLSFNANAHIELLDPPARYPLARSGDNKACPCGDGTSNRSCGVEGERSDDNRSTSVTTLTAGEPLIVRFDEYVGHSGRFRVAFDENGADLADFNAHPLEDIPDPAGKTGNTGDGSIWEIPVVVPDTPCENCTLQLIQMMDGDMSAPVADPVGRSSYYACADITIVAADTPLEDAAEEDAEEDAEDVASSDASCALGPGLPAHGAATRSHAAAVLVFGFFALSLRRAQSARVSLRRRAQRSA